MRQKEKIKDTVIRTDVREDGGYRYLYELVMRVSGELVSLRMPLYSVRVTLTDSQNRASTAEIRDAFADAGRAIIFYEKIVRNLATPIDLSYIHEDDNF